ncbi:hypothetical protein L249_5382, partial [Ophiocordyceps polyrhachis-furcata BCC 54312]
MCGEERCAREAVIPNTVYPAYIFSGINAGQEVECLGKYRTLLAFYALLGALSARSRLGLPERFYAL